MIALVSLFFTGRIPDVQPGSTDSLGEGDDEGAANLDA